MLRLSIHHTTTYRYGAAVELGPHRLMLRPRESRDLRLLAMELNVNPQALVNWAQDVAGNAVATATFQQSADHLVITSHAEVELAAEQWPVFAIAASAQTHPIQYSAQDAVDLGALALPLHADPAGRLRTWAKAFVRGTQTDTLALLKDINAGVHSGISYQTRFEEGTQSPLQSLERASGSCRDLALLFVEAVRTLGFGARVVSGYLYNPLGTAVGSGGAGSTHAWAEVYLPGAGWIAFDPTNASVGGANLVPVAVGRDMSQVMPVSGSFSGGGGTPADMVVEIHVARV